MIERWMIWPLAGVLGLALGSFLNVCALRWPQDESVVSPPSRCPSCGRGIRWHENIPVLGWILLGGRCRGCGSRISIQYPLVELTTGLIWAGLFWQHGLSWEGLRGALFLTILMGIAVSDARFYIIPDEFSLGGAVLGLALALAPGGPTFVQALVGAVVGFGGFWLFGWASTRYVQWKNPDRLREAFEDHDRSRSDEGLQARVAFLQRPVIWMSALAIAGVLSFVLGTRTSPPLGAAVLAGLVAAMALLFTWGESFTALTFADDDTMDEGEADAPASALGGGDVKMMALVGAFLGPAGVGLTLFLGAALAVVSWLPLHFLFRQLIPFGIFLAYGAAIAWAAGDQIIAWYLVYVGLA